MRLKLAGGVEQIWWSQKKLRSVCSSFLLYNFHSAVHSPARSFHLERCHSSAPHTWHKPRQQILLLLKATCEFFCAKFFIHKQKMPEVAALLSPFYTGNRFASQNNRKETTYISKFPWNSLYRHRSVNCVNVFIFMFWYETGLLYL